MLNLKGIAALLAEAIEGTEKAIEFYVENEGHCDDEEQAEAEREHLEFLLDDLVKAYDEFKEAGKHNVVETFDRRFVDTPFVVRKVVDCKPPQYDSTDVAMFANKEAALQYAKQIEEDDV